MKLKDKKSDAPNRDEVEQKQTMKTEVIKQKKEQKI